MPTNEKKTKCRANPSLVVRNNKKAVIAVGQGFFRIDHRPGTPAQNLTPQNQRDSFARHESKYITRKYSRLSTPSGKLCKKLFYRKT